MRVTIVGGGILGAGHALEAARLGHGVVQLEREAEARGSTVRNFGLVWVSGRAHGEFAATLRSRELWEKLDAAVESRQALPAMREHMARPPAGTRSSRAPRHGPSMARPFRTIAAFATTATSSWCAQAQPTAVWSASSSATCPSAGCACR